MRRSSNKTSALSEAVRTRSPYKYPGPLILLRGYERSSSAHPGTSQPTKGVRFVWDVPRVAAVNNPRTPSHNRSPSARSPPLAQHRYEPCCSFDFPHPEDICPACASETQKPSTTTARRSFHRDRPDNTITTTTPHASVVAPTTRPTAPGAVCTATGADRLSTKRGRPRNTTEKPVSGPCIHPTAGERIGTVSHEHRTAAFMC